MEIARGIHLHADTCNVYALVADRRAVLFDFGAGSILDHLAEVGAERVTDVLVTHHHRDQVQGLQRAVAHGARIWVPPAERDLFDRVDEHWQARAVDNYYDLRQDRFSLLEPVQIAGTVQEYLEQRFGDFTVTPLPTPGHTIGSVSYLVDSGGCRLVFSGDLIYGPGQLWSLAATQWSYSGAEGLDATVFSLWELRARQPDLVLPSHGAPIHDPIPAFDQLARRARALADGRRDAHESPNLETRYEQPYEILSPHLLRNRSSMATTYVLLSDTGGALFIDFGYDMVWSYHPTRLGQDRSSRRPWLSSLRVLRRDFGVDRIEVAIPTHYHDDHVAGLNLLREVEGTEVWAEKSVAEVLRDPIRFDLPCLWYDPIPVDRELAPASTTRWREYDITVFPLPGHTRYAAAVGFEVDGRRVLATGDQQDGMWVAERRTELLNYQYKNRFHVDDFLASARLYQNYQPDLLISGHWPPRKVDDDYVAMLLDRGKELARQHREILPLSEVDFGTEGFGARIEPYRVKSERGQPFVVNVSATNPFEGRHDVTVELIVPSGWSAEPSRRTVSVRGRAEVQVEFLLVPAPEPPRRRARVAADLTVGEQHFGQHAEALVDVS